MTTYPRAYSKLSELHFNVLLFSNHGEKGKKKVGVKLDKFGTDLHDLLHAIGEQHYIEI